MYLSDADNQLGFDPVTAAFSIGSAVSAIKSLFGFGKKKAALQQIEANAAGAWTSQLPPYADWAEFLNRPYTPTNAKEKAAGVKTMKAAYDFWRGRKDSILIKNQIATPEDFGAYIVITYGLKDGWINPNSKPGSALYKNGPFAMGSQIPIFDYEAVTRWANMQAAKTSPVQLTPANVLPPQFDPATGQWIAPAAASPDEKPQLKIAAASMLPLALLGAAAVFMMTRAKGRN